MLDLRDMRQRSDYYKDLLGRRGISSQDLTSLLSQDEHCREKQTDLQKLQEQRNDIAKEVGHKKARGEDASPLIKKTHDLKKHMSALEKEVRECHSSLENALAQLPNILDDRVPIGQDETHNEILSTWGQKPDFDFTPKTHEVLGEGLEEMDFTRAAAMSGSRFCVLKGDLARLERALGQWMLDIHTQRFEYTLVSPPYLVHDHALFGTGQLPKFGEDSFQTQNNMWLIPTAEVSLTNLVRESILKAEDMPLRFVALTPCFRLEAGAAGRDTRGMIRQHQFHKVELVSITHPRDSEEEHQRMTHAAETILQELNLCYRRVLLCSGDTGASAAMTYDLEAWMPGQQAFREISSCSNTLEYQARRMKTRYREEGAEKKGPLAHVHTLNGSGVAVGRALIAVLENYQEKDGSIVIPPCLRPYMNHQERISA